jgi:drug/metabolite transporter (DMT)-like permease
MSNGLSTALEIATIVVSATAGDVFIAAAMRSLGDLDLIRESKGLLATIFAVLTNYRMVLGIIFMTTSFYSLLFALNHGSLSLVAPASTALTFVTNSLAAKIFLKENVDRRRWTAAVLVCCGVVLMAL